MDEYVTVAEAATRLGVDVATVRRRIQRGEIAARRVNPRLWLIPRGIVASLAHGKQRPGPNIHRPDTRTTSRVVEQVAPAGVAQTARRPAPSQEPAVERFLAAHPEVATLVAEASEQLGRYFPNARTSLQLVVDPEYGVGEQLFLGVSTELPEEEALALLRRFDREWWVQHVGRARGLLCIDLSDE